MMTADKLAAGIAGTTGTGSIGVLAAALRVTATREVPAGMWTMLAILASVTAAVPGLAIVLAYRRQKLEIETQAGAAETAVMLQWMRLEMYRTMLEKSVGEPGSMAVYRELIIADALHLSVEQNGVERAERRHTARGLGIDKTSAKRAL